MEHCPSSENKFSCSTSHAYPQLFLLLAPLLPFNFKAVVLQIPIMLFDPNQTFKHIISHQ
jgi:hypothetical protein